MNKIVEKAKSVIKNKDFLISFIGVLFLLTISTSFAFFTIDFNGSRTVLLSSSGLIFTYKENNVLDINTHAMSDEEGKVQDNYFDFEVSLKSSEEFSVDYFIYLEEDATSTLSNENVKVYITNQEDQGLAAPVIVSDLKDYLLEGTHNVKEIYDNTISTNDNIKVIDKYRLRVWADLSDITVNKTDNNNEQIISTNNYTYKFKVNVSTYGGTATNKTCFEWTEAGTEITITNYKCYNNNSFGMPVVTDVVIPNKINGKQVVAIANTTSNATTGRKSFYNRGLTSVIIPNNVRSIGNYAFYQNVNLTSLLIGSNVKTIGNYAFYQNNISNSLIIPDSVETIGDYAFRENTNLKSLTVGKNVKTIGNYAFYQNNITGLLIIPNSVEIIGTWAFYLNANLTSLTLGQNVKTIETRAFSTDNISGTLIIPNSVETIGDYAFTNNINLSGLTLGNNVETIGTNAFAYNNISGTLVIPGMVESIGSSAFRSNVNLTNLTLGNKVKTIGGSAFQENNITGTLIIPNSVDTIDYNAFMNNPNLSSLTLGNNVKTIGNNAFTRNNITGTLIIPNSVETIGNNAFEKSSSSNKDLTIIINKTGKVLDWGLIVNGISGYNFINGTVVNSYSNVIVSAS